MTNHQNNLNEIHSYNIDVENREIYLHSYYSDLEEEGGVDYRSAVTFEKNLRYLNQVSLDPITIHMHLPGGNWTDCLSIFDSIRLSKSKTIMIAYGSAESSSGVILQAPSIRILMPNTTVMIHYGSISLDGEHSKAAASSVQWNETECDKMIDIFTHRCMESSMAKQKNWKKMMARKHIVSQLASRSDWILTATEAVNYGFADGILGSKQYPNIDYIKNLAKKLK